MYEGVGTDHPKRQLLRRGETGIRMLAGLVALLATLALILLRQPVTWPLIWLAHIGFDRALGYGLKHPSAFQHTHLGLIGKPESADR